MDKKTISIFGVSGSIGQSTRDVILSAPERFDVCTVTANANVTALAQMARELGAKRAIIADENLGGALNAALVGSGIEALAGRKALIEAAREKIDLHVAAIVGMAGLEPLFKALESARSVAIANKEPLVAAGRLFVEKAKVFGTQILPLDSEHNAIFQVFERDKRDAIERLILTASGGPFLNRNPEEIGNATPEEATSHPNWSMGAKISVDSASMMNKALEIIEAHYLFGMPAEKIDVLIHPQSVVHSMVEYADGSVLAQMGASDMRTPITYALGWPKRLKTPGKKLDFVALSQLDFMPPDLEKFPALKLAYDCLKLGDGACIALNASNEVAVQAFLSGKIRFGNIIPVISKVLDEGFGTEIKSLESVIECDKEVRAKAHSVILSMEQTQTRKAS